MADNLAITAGSGTTIAADEIGGAKYQRIKLVLGADGAADMDLDSGQQTKANSVPVTLASDSDFVKAEDAAHSSGDKGIAALAVRKDTAAALAGTDGDYTPLESDSTGRLHTRVATYAPTNATLHNAATATGTGSDVALDGHSLALVKVTEVGSPVYSIQIQAQSSASAWNSLTIYDVLRGGWILSISKIGYYYVPIAGFNQIRASISVFSGATSVSVSANLMHVPFVLPPVNGVNNTEMATIGLMEIGGRYETHRKSPSGAEGVAQITGDGYRGIARIGRRHALIVQQDYAHAFARNNTVAQANGLLVSTNANMLDYSQYAAPTTAFFNGADAGFDAAARHILIPCRGIGLWAEFIGFRNALGVNAVVSVYGWHHIDQAADNIPNAPLLDTVTLATAEQAMWIPYVVGANATSELRSLQSMIGWEAIIVSVDPASDPGAGSMQIYVDRVS